MALGHGPRSHHMLPTNHHTAPSQFQTSHPTTFSVPFSSFQVPNIQQGGDSGITAGSFGVVAGIFALQFFSEVPKVRRDIMQKIPVIGEYFERDIPPSDNPY
ncbi:MAG: hypothetical protein Q9191_005135 [Dirinaria sp. TL-2023a]